MVQQPVEKPPIYNELTDGKEGVRWGKVARNTAAGAAEAYTAVTGFGGLKAGLDNGKSASDAVRIAGKTIKSSVGADVATMKQGVIKGVSAIKQGVIKGISKVAPAMGSPAPGEVTGEVCSGESGSRVYNLDSKTGKIPNAEYNEILENSVHNTESDTLTLGKYEPTIEADVTSNYSKLDENSYNVVAEKMGI